MAYKTLNSLRSLGLTKDIESIPKLNHLVVIEGIDGCGKDTQLKKFGDEGFYVSSEPNYNTDIGKLIRKILNREIPITDPDLLEYLFAEDRIAHSALLKKFEEKKCVTFTGRYLFSGLAYSPNPKLTWALNKDHFMLPGLIIRLCIDPHEAAKRVNSRRKGAPDIYETEENLIQVDEKYDLIFKRFGDYTTIINIPAIGTVDGVYKNIMRAVKNHFDRLVLEKSKYGYDVL